jgi:predicted transcriptional regulator
MELLPIDKSHETTIHINHDTDEKFNSKILYIIADKYCRQILTASMNSPKCSSELAHETGIPISTVYRRLQNLLDARLVDISGSISEDGKKFFLYKTRVKEIHTKMNRSSIETLLVMGKDNGSKL